MKNFTHKFGFVVPVLSLASSLSFAVAPTGSNRGNNCVVVTNECVPASLRAVRNELPKFTMVARTLAENVGDTGISRTETWEYPLFNPLAGANFAAINEDIRQYIVVDRCRDHSAPATTQMKISVFSAAEQITIAVHTEDKCGSADLKTEDYQRTYNAAGGLHFQKHD